jgi:hypothetical protein
MEPAPLIRVRVLSDLLVQTLDGLDDETLKSPQLIDELRALSDRAAQELQRLDDPGGE